MLRINGHSIFTVIPFILMAVFSSFIAIKITDAKHEKAVAERFSTPQKAMQEVIKALDKEDFDAFYVCLTENHKKDVLPEDPEERKTIRKIYETTGQMKRDAESLKKNKPEFIGAVMKTKLGYFFFYFEDGEWKKDSRGHFETLWVEKDK